MNMDSINAGECSKENMINVEENQTQKEDSVNTSALSMPKQMLGKQKRSSLLRAQKLKNILLQN